MIDPYPIPFEWSNDFEMLFVDVIGLLPCLCEQRWLPLMDGSYVACSICNAAD